MRYVDHCAIIAKILASFPVTKEYAVRKCYLALNAKRNRLYPILMAVIWILGLIIGCIYARFYRLNYATPWLLHLSNAEFSVFGFIAIGILPLVVSLALVKVRLILLLPVVFLKSITFSFTTVLIMGLYSEAGWLVRWLLLFTDSVSVIPLVYCWFFCCKPDSTHLLSRCYIQLFLLTVIACFDYFVVLPFTAMLL